MISGTARGGLLDVHRDPHELGARLARARGTAAPSPSTSAVSVFDMDWTTTGAPPPTQTFPTRTPTVRWRGRAAPCAEAGVGAAGPDIRR